MRGRSRECLDKHGKSAESKEARNALGRNGGSEGRHKVFP